MLKSSLCDYSDVYIVVGGTITIAAFAAGGSNNDNKQIVFKNCIPFTDFIIEINNAQVDNGKDIDAVMPMYNLIKYTNNYLKTLLSLWQYYRDKPVLMALLLIFLLLLIITAFHLNLDKK